LQDLQQLYTWLIKPFESEIQQLLQDKTIETLAFVPDENLRLVPLAALHDGKQYLIERLPISNLVSSSAVVLSNPAPEHSRFQAMGLSQSRQGFAPLPGVRSELQQLEKLYSSPILLDESFVETKVRDSLLAPTDDPKIVHMATHAQFGLTGDDTFIVLWDKRLSLNDLKALDLRSVNLLTMSACETAVADGKAGQGLAGIADRVGADSVIGTLWSVNDTATSKLMEAFYGNLKGGMGKAKALQQAQLSLLKNNLPPSENSGDEPASSGKANYRTPFYWAAFVLLGNWQ